MTKVTGECSNCHTMHASQNGTFLGGPNPVLLKTIGNYTGCLACHSDDGSETLKQVGSSVFPIVWNRSEPTYPLAAGNFYYVATGTGNDTKGHNVAGIAGQDSVIGSYTPPGWKKLSTDWGPNEDSWSNQLTCSGRYGCHGLRNTNDTFAAIRGLHHNETRPYRFLYGDANSPIQGKEDPNYEKGKLTGTPTGSHNVYKGNTVDDVTTISYFCGQCHGKFHKHSALGGTTEVGSQSPWLRHPTDISLAASDSSPFTTDYGSSNNTYNYETPVAFATLPDPPISTFTNGIVMCLSCHRAHASSKYNGNVPDDILRFNYSDIKAGIGVTTGCNRCHARQR